MDRPEFQFIMSSLGDDLKMQNRKTMDLTGLKSDRLENAGLETNRENEEISQEPLCQLLDEEYQPLSSGTPYNKYHLPRVTARYVGDVDWHSPVC